MPLFSIGVTTYDRVELLIETLSSITAQTFADFEVIVGNDNPERTLTAEALGVNDQRIRFVNHASNLGELSNMNTLLDISRGRYFTWLADDDLYAPTFLAAVAEALEKCHYPSCVFSSFVDFDGTTKPEVADVRAEQFRLLTGRDFIRSYLVNDIRVIGVMGFFAADYLRQMGGLEDVSADGMGFYCEYMILIRSALLDKVGYIDAPLVFYRIHAGAWGITNSDLDQYDRAGKNLLRRSIEVFSAHQLEQDFSLNVRQLLKRVMINYINVARASETFRLYHLIAYLVHVRKYIKAQVGSRYYWKALGSLMGAELWVLGVLIKRTFLSVAPTQMIRLAYFIQSFVLRKRHSESKLESGSR